MCSKNQEVDPLFAQFITKDFLIQRIFRFLRNSLFRTNDLYSKNKTEQDLCKERTCSVLLQGYYLKKGLYFGKINPFSDQSQGEAGEL